MTTRTSLLVDLDCCQAIGTSSKRGMASLEREAVAEGRSAGALIWIEMPKDVAAKILDGDQAELEAWL